jgi:hypothetical protein
MNDFDPSGFDPRNEALNSLYDAVESEANITLALTSGPLTIDKLRRLGMVGDAVKEVAERFGWPDQTDEAIEPVHDFNSYAFIEMLQLDSASGIQSSYFYRTLEQKPIDLPLTSVSGLSVNSITGTLPVVHRAYALAPDLFSSLRAFLQTYREEDGLQGEDDIYTDLNKPKNAQAALAIDMCYRIMGGLLTVDDDKIRSALMGKSEDELARSLKVVSAHRFLIDGHLA